ncbi:glycosyl hydrolase [Glycomyces sp. NPDC021274]|uniref:glycosyl hydrolase n=1 Tax=Glycomyces sp. NPDC021274 TaxID=3155120 RepID=UPI0033F005BD
MQTVLSDAPPRAHRQRWRRLALAFLVSLAAIAASLTLSPGTASAATTSLTSAASGRCLDTTGGSATPGTAVVIRDCSGAASQQWEFTTAGELRTSGGTRCLDAYNNQTTAGTRLVIWNCNGGANQQFNLNGNGSIGGEQSGLCVDVVGAATANGTATQLWNCNGQTNQRWSSGGGNQQCTVQPNNPNATQQARNLLCFIQSQYGNHIISGQQESTWIGGPEYEMNYIYNNTGEHPAIRGLDRGDSPDFSQRAIDWWNAGGIPMIGYHMGAPTHPDGYDGSLQTVSINRVLTPGTAENRSFHERLDGAAAELQQLEDAGVAAIWRPFHEAGGTWFWWSKEGGQQYNRLWRYMYDYYTHTKGLNNLIWLHPFNGAPDAAFYPGDAYVDFSGADTYAGNGNYDPLNAMYNRMRGIVGTTMPIALHENGPIPDPARMQSTNTRWVLFNTWHGEHLTVSNSVAHLRNVYSSSYVITRDEVPDLG